MSVSRWLVAGLATCALTGAAVAQTTSYGDPNFDITSDWKSGMPTVLTVSATDQGYEFDGTPLDIPFTISGSRATVYLAVYTKGANPQYGGQAFAIGGIGNCVLRAAGLDTLVALTAGQSFREGSHTIAWSGKDYHGNTVRAGNYHYYLFAIDDVSTPTWTGRCSSPNVWTTNAWDFRANPPVIWTTDHGGGGAAGQTMLYRTPLGTDLFVNPNSSTEFPMFWMVPRLLEIKTDFAPGQWDVGWTEIDPNDPTVFYVGNYLPPAGWWKIKVNMDNQTTAPDESFGDRGHVAWEARLFCSALMAEAYKPWLEDDGLLYVSHMDRDAPYNPAILIFDRSTGELADFIDLTDLYVQERPDASPGVPYVPGPSGIDVDETGVYISSYWMDAPQSWPAKFSHDGDILWQNQNGDGFVDRYTGEEAQARGIVPIDQMVNTHCTVGTYGIFYGGGYNDPSWGYILGPDGSGILKLNLPNMPASLGGEVTPMDRGSRFDGLWIMTNGSRHVHWPYDVVRASISHGVSTAVTEVEGAAVPAAYALGDAYPNPGNPETSVQVFVPGADAQVRIAVYNMAGQEVAVLADQAMQAGQYTVTWDGRDLNGRLAGSGVYVISMRAGEFTASTKVTRLQ
jgi:flagellar hook assembly protein FlgD